MKFKSRKLKLKEEHNCNEKKFTILKMKVLKNTNTNKKW